MRVFSRLIKNDLRNRRNMLWAILCTLILFHIAFIALLEWTDINLQLALSIDTTVFVAIFGFPFMHAFSTWRAEWRQQSIHLLLSLPVSRAYFLLSKYIVILLEVLMIAIVMLTGLSVQNWICQGRLFRIEPLITFDASKLLIVFGLLLGITCLIFLCFFSVLLAACVRKAPFVVAFLIFTLGFFISSLIVTNLSQIAALSCLCLLFFFGSLYLLEQKIGTN
ncbi:ABC-2 transporter permease [Paenibacillus thalictri]|uniref:ABC transporter permease n=1 Tax=Paenibacillus thalictri TaxID=2527873 RepID=A0A4Q9DVS1_9BACL|nr:ABC-2 transporter permease [Paenibacillus thalictri]TBL80384.1 hypothetical protein EYB31_08180 [Paenibacillus thalictri]